MDMYIARQPIFTVHKKLFAYELLYRGTKEHNLTNISGNKATTSILSTTFLTEGIDIIAANKPCFVNFTEELLINQIPFSFPKSQIVIEILEDVRPTKEVIAICRKLSKEGYQIALDDFIYDRSLEPLIELADIIKIDVRLTPLDTIMRTLHKISRHSVKLLAEKVESHQEFDKANKLGFSYYQGFFFSKPETILVKELAATKINLLQLMAEITKNSTTLEKLEDIITTDIAISYKLLRFLNSSYFSRLEEVKNVKHAITYLGEKELRRFILLAIISELAIEKPGELVRLALVRAKFCELLSEKSNLSSMSSEIFLMGLFSFIDTMLETTMTEVMKKLPISNKIKDALTGDTGPYAPFLGAVIAYERRQEPLFDNIMNTLGVQSPPVAEIYLQAVKYANTMV